MPADGYRVGVLGATGAVGSTILDILAERSFPASEVVPFASERSAGRKVRFGDTELVCQVPGDDTIQGIDILISSAGGSVSEVWAPRFVEAGAVVIDNTSFWRMHEDVPLVVAGVNDDAAREHKGIVANPNCTTMVMMMALAPIHRAAGLERLILSSYQAVSGTGQKAIEDIHPLYDFNATILHLLGLDHERLTFEHNGIQRRLTNVEGHVIKEMLL